MSGNFGQYRAPERQYSDVTSVQSPVQDTSSASSLGGVAQGIAALGQTAISAFQISEQRNQRELEEERAQAQAASKAEFEAELLRAGAIADQQGKSSTGFKTFLTMAFQQSDLDFDTKSKMMKQFQETALGKVFVEDSPEEKAFNELTGKAVKAGLIPQGATPEQVKIGTARYQEISAQTEYDNAKLAKIKLEREELALKRDKTAEDRAALAEADKKLEEGKWQALTNLSANYTPALKNKVGDIVKGVRDGTFSREQAEQQLINDKRDFSATVGHLTVGMPPGAVDPLIKPMMDVFDIAIDRLDSTNILKEIENASEIMIAKSKRDQLLGSQDLVNFVGASSLSNFQSPALILMQDKEQTKVLKQMSQPLGGKVRDVTVVDQPMTSYLGQIKAATGARDQMGADGEPLIDERELFTNVSNILSSANRYIHEEEDTPKQNENIIKWLADPEVGQYVGEKYSQLPSKAVIGLSNTLANSAVNYIYPEVQSIVASDLKDNEGVEMYNLGNQVVFKATSSDMWDKSVANKLNDDVAGALTTYFRAIANVSSDNFSTIFERERPSAWPSKYGEQQEETITEE